VNRWQSVPSRNGYHLPTQEQWEHACRAGTTTTFSFGDDEAYLNHFAVCSKSGAVQREHTEPVGSKRCNGFGLFDVHGNVWEWCDDWKLNSNQEMILRGGGWSYPGSDSATTVQLGRNPAARKIFSGFRVARSSVDRSPSKP
jgi:formylglycine-generating enzyme required for sulfatase activity